MRRLLALLVLLGFPLVSMARPRFWGFATVGNQGVVTAGITSTSKVQASYPSVTVTVYLTGTLTLASIFSDNSGTPKSNPFTLNPSSLGYWFFYADATNNYDVTFTGGGIPAPFTLADLTAGGGASGAAQWGNITGTLSSQTDLQTALNAKQATITLGTTLQYLRGDLSLATLDTLAVPENTNLYFTNARARAAVSGSAPIVYNSGTGVFSCPTCLTGNAVTSVFTRTGAVVATTGDYTAAQVTNAVDSTSSYANPTWITSLAASKVANTVAQWNANQLQGRALASLAPSDLQYIGWNAGLTQWEPKTITAGNFGTITTGTNTTATMTCSTGCTVTFGGTGIINANQLTGRKVASTAPTDLQYLGWNNGSSQWEPKTSIITSVFGRTGAVVAAGGDYTASQVTNAVDKTAANTGAAGMTLDMSASTAAAALRVPNIAGATTTSAGAIVLDTTNKNLHLGANSVDNIVPVVPTSVTPADNDCVKWTITAGVRTLNTAGGVCSTNAVTSVFGRTGAVAATSGDYTAAQVTNAVDKTAANTYTAGQKQTFSPNATNAGINIGSVSGDPSTLSNGDQWYDSGSAKFRCRQGGSSVDCIASGGTPAFSAITSGTGTNHYTVGTGGTLDTSGTAAVTFATSGHTAPMQVGTTAGKPATCTVGDKYFANDATAGQNDFNCTATNTWTQETGGSGGASVTSGTYASLPGTCTHTSTQSDLYYFLDSAYQNSVCTATNTWTLFLSQFGKAFDPQVQTWSWVNQSSAIVDSTFGGIVLTGTANGGYNQQCRFITAPATPYTITAAFEAMVEHVNTAEVGLAWRDSSTGKMTHYSAQFGTSNGPVFGAEKSTNATTYAGSDYTLTPNSQWGGNRNSLIVLQIKDDGTNHIRQLCIDGNHCVTQNTVSRTDFLAVPDQVGMCVNSNSSNTVPVLWMLSFQVH